MRPVGPRPSTLEERLDVLNPRTMRALRAAHEALDRLGVPHALVGALAVGVHGHARATKVVELLVGPEAFEASGVLVSFKPGVPLAADGVAIDSIPLPTPDDPVFSEALRDPVVIDGVPALRVEPLLYMKLTAGRRQDLADVVALLRAADVDLDRVRASLASSPDLLARFESLVREADEG